MTHIDLYDHVRSLESAVRAGDSSSARAQAELADLYDLLSNIEQDPDENLVPYSPLAVHYVEVTTSLRFGNITQTVTKRVIRSRRPQPFTNNQEH